METESGWYPLVAAAARRVMNQTTAMCVEVNLCVYEAVQVQTELIKSVKNPKTAANTASQNIRDDAT